MNWRALGWGIVIASWAAAGCAKRTEVVVGIATDIEAPDAIDEVQLRVTREGVPLFNQSWEVSGLIGKPFELPGSFGLNSPDGSAPRVEVAVVGLKAEKEILKREAVVTLVGDKTLFMRMALVKRCIPTECQPGFTCIEGRCQDSTVDGKILPDYVTDLEKSVTCSSGTRFVNTSTKLPLPVMGSGDCEPDETCGEGICYKPAEPGVLPEVSGSQIATFVNDAGETVQPVDLSKSKIQALVASANGGYTIFPGSGRADGSFVVPGVPAGPYLLQIDTNFSAHTARTLDLGDVRLGRPNAVTATTLPIGLVYNFTGLTPWDPHDVLEGFSAGTNFFAFDSVDSSGMSPPTGTTSVSNFRVDYLNSKLLVDTSKGDGVIYEQLHYGTAMNGVQMLTPAAAFTPPSVIMRDGQDTVINGALTPTPADKTFSMSVAGGIFEPLGAQVNPKAQPFGNNFGDTNASSSYILYTRPGPASYGSNGASLDLLYASPPATGGGISASVSYASLQPKSWGVIAQFDSDWSVDYLVPGTTQAAQLAGTIRIGDDPQKLSAGPTQPLLTPVRDPRIDGKSLFVDGVIGLTPTLTWTPGSGTPTRINVMVQLLKANGMATQIGGLGAFLVLPGNATQVTLPPGLLTAGQHVVIRVQADLQTEVSERQPNRLGLPFANADVLSGLFTVVGEVPATDDAGTKGPVDMSVVDLNDAGVIDLGGKG